LEGKELFTMWAPQDGYTWTRYAKPALFMHPTLTVGEPVHIQPLPQDLLAHLGGGVTAVIVDLPGAEGVAAGLDLAGVGFRPVPLYNGIHVAPAPGRRNAVDNEPIIQALHDNAAVLPMGIGASAPPAFLLDAKRNENIVPSLDLYDNRWTLDLDDMPDFMYLRAQGIQRVVIWTDRNVQDDLAQICGRYQSAGIEVFTYMQAVSVTDAELTTAIHKFEFAKIAMYVIAGLAVFNFLGMFSIREAPFLWTTPTVMWLTYLWLPEAAGDAIAFIFTAGYVVLAILMRHIRRLLTFACAAVALESVILFIYAMWYGLVAYTGYSLLYGLAVFGIPIAAIIVLMRAWRALPLVVDLEPTRYTAIAETFYETRVRTGFRGFRGYGGRGYGGYGGGYGGYGGFGG